MRLRAAPGLHRPHRRSLRGRDAPGDRGDHERVGGRVPADEVFMGRCDQLARHRPCAGAALLHALRQKDQRPAPNRFHRHFRRDRRGVPLRRRVK